MNLTYALLSVNNICNFRCKHCYVLKEHPQKMTVRDMNQVAEYFIDEVGIKRINIIGGEPFLCSNVNSMLKIMQKHPDIEIEMVTNGSILNKETINLLKKANLQLLKVSIHAFSEENFNWFTHTKNMREKVFNNIKYFAKEFPFGINITVMKTNYDEIIEMIKCFMKWGVKNFWISQLTPSGDGLQIKNNQLSLREIMDLKRKLLSHFSPNQVNIRYDDYTICKFGQLLAISPIGDVYPCAALLSYTEYKVGTIYSTKKEIVNSINNLLKIKKEFCFVRQVIKS